MDEFSTWVRVIIKKFCSSILKTKNFLKLFFFNLRNEFFKFKKLIFFKDKLLNINFFKK